MLSKAYSVSDGRVSEKGRVTGNSGRHPKMDNVAKGLAHDNESLYYHARVR